MSPISVALPAPPFEVSLRGIYGVPTGSPQAVPEAGGTRMLGDYFNWTVVPALGHAIVTSAALGSGNRGSGWGAVGTTGTINRYASRHGRSSIRWARNNATASGIDGNLGLSPTWRPAWDPAGLSPGFQADPDSAVYVVDITASIEGLVPPTWPSDSAPFFFLPHAITTVNCQCTPGYAGIFPGAPENVGGFGIFLNATPSSEWQYASWDENYNVLERVPLLVDDVTDFNTFRVQIITARPGIPAQLSVAVNSAPPVLVRDFGSPELLTPMQASANVGGAAGNYSLGCANIGENEPVYVCVETTQGRFTPDGREIQGI